MRCQVSVMIFTLDEEVNLPHCLSSLHWCDDVIVIDSGSSDATETIARSAGTRWFSHAFSGFGSQRNWAMDNCSPTHPWILMLDADEQVPEALAIELNQLVVNQPDIGAARLKRRFIMWGKWLRYSTQYPVWVVRLVHKDRVRYQDRGHAETQQVNGAVVALNEDLIDQNHKDLEYWYQRQMRYAEADAIYELANEQQWWRPGELLSTDPLERRMALKRLAWKMPFRGPIYFLYSYLLRLGFRDGVAGFKFCRLRAWYQSQVVANKRRLRREARSEVI